VDERKRRAGPSEREKADIKYITSAKSILEEASASQPRRVVVQILTGNVDPRCSTKQPFVPVEQWIFVRSRQV